MQQNSITHISHLEGSPELDTLNISNNLLTKLEGLSASCPKVRCTTKQMMFIFSTNVIFHPKLFHASGACFDIRQDRTMQHIV